MRHMMRLLMAALVAAAVATIVLQRERLRQMDRAEMVAQIREAIESRIPHRKSLEETVAEAIDDPVEPVAVDG